MDRTPILDNENDTCRLNLVWDLHSDIVHGAFI